MQTSLHKIGILQLFLVALHFHLVRIQLGTQLRQWAHIVLPNGVAAADGRRGNAHTVGPNDPPPLLRAGHILTCGTGAQDDSAAAIRNTSRQRCGLKQLHISRVGRYHTAADTTFIDGGIQQAEHHVHIAEPPPNSRNTRQIENTVQERRTAQHKRRYPLSFTTRNTDLPEQTDKGKSHTAHHPAKADKIQRAVGIRAGNRQSGDTAFEGEYLLMQVIGDHQ